MFSNYRHSSPAHSVLSQWLISNVPQYLLSVLRVSLFKPVSTVHLQVKQRANECIMALDKLTQINSGVPVHNVLQTQFDWTTLQVNARLNLETFC